MACWYHGAPMYRRETNESRAAARDTHEFLCDFLYHFPPDRGYLDAKGNVKGVTIGDVKAIRELAARGRKLLERMGEP